MILSTSLGLAAGAVAVEAASRLFRHRFLAASAARFETAVFLFGEATDDINRQRAVLQAATGILGVALWATVILALIGALLYVPPEWLDFSDRQDTYFMGCAAIGSVAVVWARRRSSRVGSSAAPSHASVPLEHLRPTTYRLPERLLHWLALEFQFARAATFAAERMLFGRQTTRVNPSDPGQGPVYVCGLARSGTTILLEILADTAGFASLRYGDMPFVLAPNLWHRIGGSVKANATKGERAHGDGIAINADSPENFEEVFWRTFCEPLNGQGLAYSTIDEEALDAFSSYRKLCVLSQLGTVGRGEALRYLSKNNNNVLRLQGLLATPSARVVLAVRHPVATAWSLYRLHQRFCKLQGNDGFARAYMRWLGHHEFGLTHRPFGFAVQDLIGMSPDQPDYWLAYWISTYRHLLSVARHPQVLVVSHEQLCTNAVPEITRILTALGVQADAATLAQHLRAPVPLEKSVVSLFSPDLIEEAARVHHAMLELGGLRQRNQAFASDSYG